MFTKNSFRDNTTGVTYEAVDAKNLSCKGCEFDDLDCVSLVPLGCTPGTRKDHRSIIWIKQKDKVQEQNYAA